MVGKEGKVVNDPSEMCMEAVLMSFSLDVDSG